MQLHASKEPRTTSYLQNYKGQGKLSCSFSGGVVFFQQKSCFITKKHTKPLSPLSDAGPSGWNSVAGTHRALTVYQYRKVKSECLGNQMVSSTKLQIHSVTSKVCRASYALYFAGIKTSMYLESHRCTSQHICCFSYLSKMQDDNPGSEHIIELRCTALLAQVIQLLPSLNTA